MSYSRQLTRITVLAISLLISIPANSGPIEDGFIAFKQGDKELAYKHWLPLAIQGDARSQFFLSMLYENWTGGAEDRKNAKRWLTASANNGFVPAIFNLGNNYHQGRYGAINNKMAEYWWTQAAVQGFVDAQYHLATIYYWGIGLPQDLKEAFYWFDKAAKNGSQEASDAVLQMRARNQLQFRERSGPSNIAYDDPRIVSRLALEPQEKNAVEDVAIPIAASVLSAKPEPQPRLGPRLPVAQKDEVVKESGSSQSSGYDWVSQQPTSNFTIQLYASGRSNHCDDYVKKLRELYQLETYSQASVRKRKRLCSVIYGSYVQRAEAKAKLEQLPRKIRRLKPWIRKIAK